MQSEGFDNKIKKAAEHHHPAYDEKAWEKMSKLLDKHLPTKKDENKRRGFIFFLFFLFIGGAGVLLTINWNNNRSVKMLKSDSSVLPNKPLNNKEYLKVDPTVDVQLSNPFKAFTAEGNLMKKKRGMATKNYGISAILGKNITQVYTGRGKKQSAILFINTYRRQLINQPGNDVGNKKEIEKEVFSSDKTFVFTHMKDDVKALVKPDVSADSANYRDQKSSTDIISDKKNERISIVNDEKIANPDMLSLKKQGLTKMKKNSYFHFSLSTGPDVSFTGSDNFGQVRLLTGIGMSYTFKERFTISTGFYSVKKIYSASAAAYKPPADFFNYYPYLEKVDADCKVYEIPLSFSLNLGLTKKGNWLVSTGISSYLMKKETYKYYYKYSPTGPTVNKTWTLSDKNKHYFSVFNLSGGYRFRLNKAISVSFEPFAKIPLRGVGYGKVKLNSGGVLLSVGVKLFNSKNK